MLNYKNNAAENPCKKEIKCCPSPPELQKPKAVASAQIKGRGDRQVQVHLPHPEEKLVHALVLGDRIKRFKPQIKTIKAEAKVDDDASAWQHEIQILPKSLAQGIAFEREFEG